MLTTLENDVIRLSVDTHGAEIHSLVLKETGDEYIWQAGCQILAETCSGTVPICRQT